MSEHQEYHSAEGVMLIRRNGATMAIHLTAVIVDLTPVIIEHDDVQLGYATLYGGTRLDHYEVAATGQADRLYLWTGPDPFAKAEIATPMSEVEQ